MSAWYDSDLGAAVPAPFGSVWYGKKRFVGYIVGIKRMIFEVESHANGVGNDVAAIDVYHGLTFEPVLILSECEGVKYILVELVGGGGDSREVPRPNKEGNVENAEGGGLYVGVNFAVLNRSEKEEKCEYGKVCNITLGSNSIPI